MSVRWWISLVLLAAVVVGVYFLWPARSVASIDPELKDRFETTQKPIVMKLIESETMLERMQLVGQLQKTIVDLSEQQRRTIFEYAQKHSPELRDAFIAREQRRMDEFYKLSPEEQVKALDKHIDEMESMRTMFAGMRGPGGMPPGPPDSSRKINSDVRRQLRVQHIMNNTTAMFRAQMSDYMQRVDERRKERGLPDGPRPGPGP